MGEAEGGVNYRCELVTKLVSHILLPYISFAPLVAYSHKGVAMVILPMLTRSV